MTEDTTTESSQAPEQPQQGTNPRFSRLAAAVEAAYILEAVRA
jgi:hypothetical protein